MRPGGAGEFDAVKAAVQITINPRAGTLGSTMDEDSMKREEQALGQRQHWGLPEVRGADGAWQRYVPARGTPPASG